MLSKRSANAWRFLITHLLTRLSSKITWTVRQGGQWNKWRKGPSKHNPLRLRLISVLSRIIVQSHQAHIQRNTPKIAIDPILPKLLPPSSRNLSSNSWKSLMIFVISPNIRNKMQGRETFRDRRLKNEKLHNFKSSRRAKVYDDYDKLCQANILSFTETKLKKFNVGNIVKQRERIKRLSGNVVPEALSRTRFPPKLEDYDFLVQDCRTHESSV